MSWVERRRAWLGEVSGGLGASAVLLPQALAIGVTLATSAGLDAGNGALYALITSAVVCLVTGLIGGAAGLVSGPTGPTLVLQTGALAAFASHGVEPAQSWLVLLVTVASAGGMVCLLALAGGGRLIKFIPFPVVSGFMTGSALLMVLSQLTVVRGATSAATWHWLPLASAATTVLCARAWRIPGVPGPLVGLACGTLTFHALAYLSQVELADGWLIGALPAFTLQPTLVSWAVVAAAPWPTVASNAAALALLIALNALLTAVVADNLAGTRHAARRTLFAQGLAQIASVGAGGFAGSATTAASVVAVKSGGGRWVALVVALIFITCATVAGYATTWLPRAALGGVIIAVALDVADRDVLRWAHQGRTRQDAAIALLVTVITVFYDLVLAVAVGLAIAILLYVRDQIAAPVIHRRSNAREARSIKQRSDDERALLEQYGERIVVVELRGSLFFGTADRLQDELASMLDGPHWLILHLRKVSRIDLTAQRIILQMARRLARHGGTLICCELHSALGLGTRFEGALAATSEGAQAIPIVTVNGRDEALELAEDGLLTELGAHTSSAQVQVALAGNALARQLSGAQVERLAAVLETRTLARATTVFAEGDVGDEIYLVLRGQIEVHVRTTAHHHKRLAIYTGGSFFGELGLLECGPRAASATTLAPCEVMVLTRAAFTRLQASDPAIAIALLTALCRSVVHTQRWSTRELQRLSEW